MPRDPGGRCMWYYKNSGSWQYILTFQPEDTTLLTKDMDCYTPASWYCVGMQ
jgi:hypothetical protein